MEATNNEAKTRPPGALSRFTPSFLLGLFCIFVVIVLWVGASELIQFTFDAKDTSFAKPLFLTMYASFLFLLYLLGFLFIPSWQEGARKSWAWYKGEGQADRGEVAMRAEVAEDGGEEDALEVSPLLGGGSSAEPTSTKLLPHEVFVLAVYYTPPWLFANYLFNLSLCKSCGTGTTVASNTVLNSTATLWALLIAIAIKDETATITKLLSVAMSFCGAVLVTGVDFGQDEAMLGDIIVTCSAIGFGLLSILLKRAVPDEGAVDFPMFFGFVGITHTLLCIPIMIGFHFSGLETFEPVSSWVMLCLTINGLLGTVASNVVWATAIQLTSPLITNLGTSLSIPFSFLADYINPLSKNPSLDWKYVLGTLLILLSFIVVSAIEDQGGEGEEEGEKEGLKAASDVLELEKGIDTPLSPPSEPPE